MKILIVDDETAIAKLLESVITRRGHTVDVFFDGGEALEQLKKETYDLLITDHNMPEVTGIELIKYVKKNCPSTRSVLLTGYQVLTEFFAKTVGADEYLAKPFPLKQFEEVLSKYESQGPDAA